MAMLAEPRRRQKIGPNPRGNFFLEDNENKGRTMLQKLGWQSGDGLGRRNQGMQAPIKPKIQNDAKGLGYDVKNDPWIAHTEEFAELLKSLQPVNMDNDEVPPEEVAVTSKNDGGLEEKSKALRSRIHYHKFVKNKDVSKFSTKDLSCIFGKPTDELGKGLKKENGETQERKKRKQGEVDSDGADSEGKARQGFGFGSSSTTEDKAQEEDNEEFQTINRGSMQDYFSQRLSEKPVVAKEEPKKDDKIINRGSMIDYFKEMMAKRREAAATATVTNASADDSSTSEEIENKLADPVVLMEEIAFSSDECLQKKKSKKSKKEKRLEVSETVSEVCSTVPKYGAVEPPSEQIPCQDSQDKPDKKSKKWKKSRKNRLEDSESLQVEQLPSKSEPQPPDHSDETPKDGNEETVSKKAKKHKKKDVEVIPVAFNTEEENTTGDQAVLNLPNSPLADDNTEFGFTVEKKNKKRKHSNDEHFLSTEGPEKVIDSTDNPSELKEKKKKKKDSKKQKVEDSLVSDEVIASCVIPETSLESSELPKKKKKKNHSDQVPETGSFCEAVRIESVLDASEELEAPKKKKKSKKNKYQDESSSSVAEPNIDERLADTDKKKKETRDKSREQESEEAQISDTFDDEINLNKAYNQKKREKRKVAKKRKLEELEEAPVVDSVATLESNLKSNEDNENTVEKSTAPLPPTSTRTNHKYRPKRPHLSQTQVVTLSKSFNGANLHELHGYPHY